jgi:hypothetical protein
MLIDIIRVCKSRVREAEKRKIELLFPVVSVERVLGLMCC